MTTITMPRRLMRPVATRPARRSLLIGFGATILAALLVLVGASLAIGIAAAGNVLPGVTVAGVQVGGLDRAAVEARLAEELPSLSSGEVTLLVGTADQTVTYAEIGRGYELDAMVDAALAVGRAGNPIADGIARLRTLVTPASLPVQVHAYDADALDRVAAEVADGFSLEAVDAAVTRAGATFEVNASRIGRGVETEAVRDAIAAVAATADPADARIELSAASIAPAVTTVQAREAAQAARDMAAGLELTVPGAAEDEEPITLGAETIAAWIGFGAGEDGSYAPVVDAQAVEASIAALAETVDREPVNAKFSVAGSGLGGVIAATNGRALDVDETTDSVLTTLEERAGGAPVATLAMAVDVTEPGYTTAEAEAALPQMQMISAWTTYYVPGESNGFGNNINIPARDIDGRNLAPGEWFSFWDSIGPVTPERGFQYGGVIINGRSVPNGAIGGGICSTSTTIFNAALRAGLEMGERANHYYYIDRYPDGLDATVYMDDSFVQDMTFRNDTDNPIVIRGFAGNGFVTFQLWSVPTGRRVVISDPVTSNHRAAADTVQVSSSMAPGTSRRVEFPHPGHDVSRTRWVYDADGNEIHRNTYFSSYRAVNGVVLVGPSAAAAAPEPPADDGGTAGGAAGDAPPPTTP